MNRKTVGLALLAFTLSLAGAALASAAPGGNGKGNDKDTTTTSTQTTTTSTGTQTTSINNGGGTPNCGASCDDSHNPTGFTKPCDPVPGNGCHILPDTPCGRGHGGTSIGNKHCLPPLTILKEQSSSSTGTFTSSLLSVTLAQDIYYRITVTNQSNTVYSLVADDPNCSTAALGTDLMVNNVLVTGPITLPAMGTVVYTCSVDLIENAGSPSQLPPVLQPGVTYPYTNTATVMATPVSPATGGAITLTSSVTANAS